MKWANRRHSVHLVIKSNCGENPCTLLIRQISLLRYVAKLVEIRDSQQVWVEKLRYLDMLTNKIFVWARCKSHQQHRRRRRWWRPGQQKKKSINHLKNYISNNSYGLWWDRAAPFPQCISARQEQFNNSGVLVDHFACACALARAQPKWNQIHMGSSTTAELCESKIFTINIIYMRSSYSLRLRMHIIFYVYDDDDATRSMTRSCFWMDVNQLFVQSHVIPNFL